MSNFKTASAPKRLCLICKKNAVYGKQLVCATCLMAQHLDELDIEYKREYVFHPQRKWRFDFVLDNGAGPAWVKYPLAIEIEGGVWMQGRHTRGKGFEGDIRKYNEAAKLGWTVIRFTPAMIERGESKIFLAELFRA